MIQRINEKITEIASKVRLSNSATSGNWDANVTWHFEIGAKLPNVDLCASVGAIAYNCEGIYLTRTQRGYWELPGGHIECEESFFTALSRELLEEVSLRIDQANYFGSTVINSTDTFFNKTTTLPYPNPGYIPHFTCFGEFVQDLEKGAEVLEQKLVHYNELHNLDTLEIPERGILEIGLAHLVFFSQLDPVTKELIKTYLLAKSFNIQLFTEIVKHVSTN